MPITTKHRVTRRPFVADRDSLDRDTGHTVDWDEVASDGAFGTTGKRVIPAGTIIGETGAGIAPRRASGEGITAITASGILETDAHEDNRTDARSGYGVIRGGVIYQNLLPGGAPVAGVKTELAEADATTGFGWVDYVDSSAS